MRIKVVMCSPDDLDKVCRLPGHIRLCNATLEQVMSATKRYGFDEARMCVLCAFSLQFACHLICASDSSVEYIGCCYMYDGIKEYSAPLRCCEVSMKTEDGMGVTKWGTDTFSLSYPLCSEISQEVGK